MAGLTDSIAMAREYARAFLRDNVHNVQPVPAETVEAVLLAVSELTTNAVCYAPGPFTLGLRVDDHGVVIAVSDTSPVIPVSRRPQLDGSGGLGLHLLEALTGSVDIAAHDGGKTVSVRVAL